MMNCLVPTIFIPVSWGIALCSTVGHLGITIFNLFKETVLGEEETFVGYPGLDDDVIENLGTKDEEDPYVFYLNPTYFGVAYTEKNFPHAFSSERGVYEYSNPFEITFINGIGVRLKKKKKYGEYLAQLTDKRVTTIYNPDLGFYRNIWRYIQEIFCSRVTPAAIVLAKQWRSKMAENNKSIIHIAHSEGCAITKLARTLLAPHEREKLYIIAVAPGGYIPKDDFCPGVVHYVSPLDPIPYFDSAGRVRATQEETIKTVHPVVNYTHWISHKFFHSDYQGPVIESIDEFKKCILTSKESSSAVSTL